MEYTSKLFVDFLKKLIVFDKECKSIIDVADRVVRDRTTGEQNEWNAARGRLDSRVKSFSTKKTSLVDNCRRKIQNILDQDIAVKQDDFERLQWCKETLATIHSVEKSITSRSEYENIGRSQPAAPSITLNEIMNGIDNFVALAYEVNAAIRYGQRKELAVKGAKLYGMCRRAEELLNAEISKYRSSIIANKDSLRTSYSNADSEFIRQITVEWDTALSVLDSMTAEFVAQREKSKAETKKTVVSSADMKQVRINKLIDGFCQQFPPKAFADEYSRIYSLEPSFDHYVCAKKCQEIFISAL